MQYFTFLLKQSARISGRLECITQVGQPHEPQGVTEVPLPADAKGNPAGVGNPAMLLSKTFRYQRISNGAWERNVQDPTGMHMPDLCVSESELLSSEAVWPNRDLRPCGNFLFEPRQVFH